jgi:EAL domain-containing protein (putative c-di-GMP-specific phosphodiesterase class I)
VLQRCKDAGIRIALDDFGSGYANFDQLLKIDADFLKIDGALVRQLPHSARARALVEAIISFAGSLGIPLIAEFVEDETLRRQLEAMGVQYLQGYAIGRPAPVQQFDIL